MEVRLFKHSKRLNSTLQPSGQYLQMDANLKEDCSMLYPVLELVSAGPADNTLHGYNYAYVPAFGRYYYVTDWTYATGLHVCSMAVDPLASWKTAILAQRLYIDRAESSIDGSIPDSFYQAKEATMVKDDLQPFWSADGTISAVNGIYILGIVSKAGNFGSLTFTAVDQSNLTSLCQGLLADALLTPDIDLADASFILQQSIINPIQYIKSCTWLPIAMSDFFGQQQTDIDVWRWSVAVQNKKVFSSVIVSYDRDVSIRQHPQALRGQYLNHAPYSSATLTIQPFGMIPLDLSLISSHSIHINIALEVMTGEAVLTISSADAILNRIRASVGVPVQLSQVLSNRLGMVSGGLGAVLSAGSALLGGDIIKGASGAAAGIGSAIEATIPKVSSIGSAGTFADLRGVPSITYQFYPVVDRNTALFGSPLCQSAELNTMSGYVMASGSITMPAECLQPEIQQIQTYINGGFYVE